MVRTGRLAENAPAANVRQLHHVRLRRLNLRAIPLVSDEQLRLDVTRLTRRH